MVMLELLFVCEDSKRKAKCTVSTLPRRRQMASKSVDTAGEMNEEVHPPQVSLSFKETVEGDETQRLSRSE